MPLAGRPPPAGKVRDLIPLLNQPDPLQTDPFQIKLIRTEPRVIALAASAGGLRALSVILAALPPDFPAPVLVAQHVAPTPPSALAHLLSRRTALPVREARQGDRLQAGRVYVAPSGRHLQLRPGGTLSLTVAETVGLGRPSADLLFASLADSVGGRAVAVVLTGAGRDGARGVRAVRAAGGVTIAQDVPSSDFPSMPRCAVETGCVDSVLALTWIAPALVALSRADESSRMRAQQDRVEARWRRYLDLFNAAPDPSLFTDLSGTVRHANAAAHALLAAVPHSLTGKPLAAFVAPKSRRALHSHLLDPAGVRCLALHLRTRRGPSLCVTLRVSSIHDAGGPIVGLHWLVRERHTGAAAEPSDSMQEVTP